MQAFTDLKELAQWALRECQGDATLKLGSIPVSYYRGVSIVVHHSERVVRLRRWEEPAFVRFFEPTTGALRYSGEGAPEAFAN